MIRPLLPNLTELRNKLWKYGQVPANTHHNGQRQPSSSITITTTTAITSTARDVCFHTPQHPTTSSSGNIPFLVLFVLLLSVTNAEEYSQAWTKTSTQINDEPIHTQETFKDNREGFLGCSFADNLCNPDEVCFDDFVFGQCLPEESEPDSDEDLDLQRFPSLSDEEKALIAFELDELDQTGFEWKDFYTQCILQNLLSFVQYNSKFDKAECSLFLPSSPLASNLDDLLLDNTDEDLFFPEDIELPPEEQQQQQQLQEQQQQQLVAEEIPEEFLEALEGLQINPETSVVPKKIPMDNRNENQDSFWTLDRPSNNEQLDEEEKGYESGDDEGIVLPGNGEELENYLNDLAMKEDLNNEDVDETPTRDWLDLQNYLRMRDTLEQDHSEEESLGDSEMESIPTDAWQSIQNIPVHDVRKIGKRNNPTEFSPNLETNSYFSGVQNDEADGLLTQNIAQLSQDQFDQLSDYPTEDDSYLLNDHLQYDSNDDYVDDDTDFEEEANIDILPEIRRPSGGSVLRLPGGGLGSSIFNRNERLDVKKPGPFYPNSANNFFLNKLLNSDSDDMDKTSEYNQTADMGQVEYEMPLLAPIKDKRDLPLVEDNAENIVEPQFVHISLGKRFKTYNQGSNFVHYLAHEFGIPEEALDDQIIEDHHVQFKVHPNPQNINAHDMAKRIDQDSSLKSKIEDQVGVQIGKAAAGGRDDIASVFYPGGSNFNLLILVVVSVSAVAALLVVGVISLLVRRRARVQKIRNQDLQEEEKGKAQQEYQQLCRDWSRSSKKSDSKPANVTTSAVKKQLQNRESKESEGSNRSSTSSCNGSKCEEPNTANMDISTGHMVLAYMEDHLKNKQRLEQEWVGLCGYEAEPCATTIAYKAENKKKNRYPDKLPYDHNRVILNAMVNASNSDYINSSTVTDHDPRNPSYVVTQAPLASTVADFWQMIWEQGCVVIVMLTRLQDNGYQLCHRYWPEEGSEQYHIFEVHLVSEHVWCDDYLVRSVYLKNTRTGETRTVTQFHFLSWPAHGVPISTKALLEFRRKVNKSYRGRSCPIAVHCSDGVGRSGTYVLIDMVLNRMAKGCKEIDIAATLEHIRDQRGGMVQSRQQFEFCLMAVAEEVHAILKALPQ